MRTSGPPSFRDVELRKDMWKLVRELQQTGVTIILTTHYIEEAEEMADRVGVINRGELILVEDKNTLMRKLGQKTLVLQLSNPMQAVPERLAAYELALSAYGNVLSYSYDSHGELCAIPRLLGDLAKEKVDFSDLHTEHSSLEDMFIVVVAK